MKTLALIAALLLPGAAHAQGWVSFPEDMKRVMLSPWVEIDTNNFTPADEAAALKKCEESLISLDDAEKSERLIYFPGSGDYKGDLDIRQLLGKTYFLRREAKGIFGFPIKWYQMFDQQGVIYGSFTRIQFFFDIKEKRYQRGHENAKAQADHFNIRVLKTHSGANRVLMVYPISSRDWKPVQGAATYLRCGDFKAAMEGTEK